MRSKNWTIAKPKPISETAVRIHDIIVRSTLSRVRSQAKWLSAVTLTSNLPALGTVCASAMPGAFCRRFATTSDRPRRPRFACKPAHDINQLGVRGAGRIAEFVDRVRIGELAKPDELKNPLPPV